MRRLILLFVTFLAAGSLWAGWQSWPQTNQYWSSFEKYSPGEALSNDKGVGGGSWWASEDALATAVSDKEHAMVMGCSTLDQGLVFTPSREGDQVMKSVVLSMRMSGYAVLPDYTGARTALAIHAPEDGPACFVAWIGSQNCWTNLYSTSLVPEDNAWYDVYVKLMKTTTGGVRAQYNLKKSGSAYYSVMALEDGTKWIDANGPNADQLVNWLEFRGEGLLGSMLGSDPRKGLYVGVGTLFDMIFEESVAVHYGGRWYVRPSVQKDGDSYVISVAVGGEPCVFMTSARRSAGREVVEVEACFAGPNDDETIPSDTNARIRLVEDVDATGDAAYRFAYVANDAWVTNRTIRASIDAEYTVQFLMNWDTREVTYRIREGVGSDGDEYQELGSFTKSSKILPAFDVSFDGEGLVHKIKGVDKTSR